MYSSSLFSIWRLLPSTLGNDAAVRSSQVFIQAFFKSLLALAGNIGEPKYLGEEVAHGIGPHHVLVDGDAVDAKLAHLAGLFQGNLPGQHILALAGVRDFLIDLVRIQIQHMGQVVGILHQLLLFFARDGLHAHHLDGVDGHGAGDDLLALGVGADHVRLGHGDALDVQGFHLGGQLGAHRLGQGDLGAVGVDEVVIGVLGIQIQQRGQVLRVLADLCLALVGDLEQSDDVHGGSHHRSSAGGLRQHLAVAVGDVPALGGDGEFPWPTGKALGTAGARRR